ncbi:serine hydrolase domain-containing protein [Paenibacillus sp. UMB4589-SE434]|uniref:serine hydrolase domain-containing protein n=1 Tax=Paenibacillus sp. UMB4589-SE434 TaxID=3046314 RepID=UPI002550B671|nr:serine hydrolase domain-containing protein [Paenibacillus sp. UMB4589-SE434]MDK8183889.1 serine hydrolase domain-containing protein [Paenibacillus sp. UMB4589-SE434]
MKRRLSWILAVVLTFTMLLPAGVMAESAATTVNYQSIQQLAAEKAELLVKAMGTVSVQYALIDNGNIVVSGQTGLNDEGKKIPLTNETMYGIGSTSKMFATVAVMKLVEEGKIDLDKPLVQYIPEFKMKDERYKKITPRMLLNHSSGLRGSTFPNAFLLGDNDTHAHDTLLENLQEQSLKADPGAYSVYCNDGFTLSEILVEKVSGLDFTTYLHKHVTSPLGMKHTNTPIDKVDAAKFAALYHPAHKGQLPVESVNVLGTGGIYSTAEDLARFSQLFTGQGKGILSDQSAKAMQQEEYKKGLWPDDKDSIINYGLGWDSVKLYPFSNYGIKAVNKGGDTMLYHASLVVLPEHNMAAAVLSSSGSSMINTLLANEMLLQTLKAKGTIKELQPAKSFGKPIKAAIPADVLKHAGYYGSTGQVMKVAMKENGEMILSAVTTPELPDQKFVYTADGAFITEDGHTKVSFVTKENGRTYIWSQMYQELPNLGQIALSQLSAEKLAANDISTEIAAAWKVREGKKYYHLSEKYTSIVYLLADGVKINKVAGLPGYVDDKMITSAVSASNPLNIPGLGSRDTMEYNFITKDGIEYLDSAGMLAVSEDAIKPLYLGKQSTVTIQPNGYARWFSIPEAATSKKLTVTLPAHSSFTVFDENGKSVRYVLGQSKTTEIELPAKGSIVFAGDIGVQIKLTLK